MLQQLSRMSMQHYRPFLRRVSTFRPPITSQGPTHQIPKVPPSQDKPPHHSSTLSEKAQPLTHQTHRLSPQTRIVAVASCKGGVGKSTVSVNLAYSLAKTGLKVGLFDADIYGPSLPTMIPMDNDRIVTDGNSLIPLVKDGVSLMSYGYAVASSGHSSPAVMRGPKVSQVVQQLLLGTQWGDLDYLVIDFPPGTGDIQLTLAQSVPITASVIVTTPQKISVVDVIKGIKMFDQLKIPTLSVVENMSYFTCDTCTTKHYPYGKGALNRLVQDFGFKLTYELPIQAEVSSCGDGGTPYVQSFPDSAIARQYQELSAELVHEMDHLHTHQGQRPNCHYDPEKGLLVSGSTQDAFYLDPYQLRCQCKCAACVDEFSNTLKLNPKKVALDVAPTKISVVGNYAIEINWSDGHSSIFPYDRLSALHGAE